MQDCHDRFISAIQELDQLLSMAESGDIRLGLSLGDVSRLYDCKLINTIYSDESRVKQLVNKRASMSLQVQEELCESIKTKVEDYLNNFNHLDRLVLFILNRNINHEIMPKIISEISNIVLGSQHVTILRQFEDVIESVSTDKKIQENLTVPLKLYLYGQNKGEEQGVFNLALSDAKLQDIFRSPTIQILRVAHRLASSTECTMIIFQSRPGFLIHRLRLNQLKILADLFTIMGYDLMKENFHKDELISQVRSLSQFLIKNGPAQCQEIVRDEIVSRLKCKCEIIQSQRHSNDTSFAVTENISSVYLPILYDNKVVFYLNMENVSIDLLTFVDFVQDFTYARIQHSLKSYKDKEFLYQIVQVSTPTKLVLAVDLEYNILYQSSQVPSSWGFLDLSGQALAVYQNLENVPMNADYKRMVLNGLNEAKSSRKSQIEIAQFSFGDKFLQTQIYVKKDEMGEIVLFFLVFDQPKKRHGNQKGGEKQQKHLDLQQEALVTLRMDKLEKACGTLQEMLHTKLTAFEIIDLIHEKSIQSEVAQQQEKAINEDVQNTYVAEYIKGTGGPRQIISQPRSSLKDLDSLHTTKTLLKEDQLNNQMIQIFKLSTKDAEAIQEYDFDITVRPEDSITLFWGMFHLLCYEDKYQIDSTVLYQFLVVLQEKYNQNSNPFHNFEHAFTVTHCSFFIIKNKLLDPYLDDIQQFACFLSALCHDIDHTGRTNNFEMASVSRLALRYNDESVLENHHVSTAFKLIQKEQYNILNNLSVLQYQTVRKFMINNILATDMKKHFGLVQQFEIKMKNGEEIITKEEDKLALAGLVVHTCDLSGPTKKFETAKKWSERIQREFDNQVEEERFMGLPVTQHLICQNLAKQELSFIRVIIRPMFVATNKILNNGLKLAVDNLDRNVKEWEKFL